MALPKEFSRLFSRLFIRLFLVSTPVPTLPWGFPERAGHLEWLTPTTVPQIVHEWRVCYGASKHARPTQTRCIPSCSTVGQTFQEYPDGEALMICSQSFGNWGARPNWEDALEIHHASHTEMEI
jgi:hypothetical protein